MALVKKIIFFSLCLIFPFISVFAQQGSVWYFGNLAGLDFNSSPPQALTDGMLVTSEGCATICNKGGQLLFYTNGVNVYNRNHITMPNGTGLLGNASTTQSSIVIPHPGDSSLYYIFTADCVENNFVNGYNYSVVDMKLNGGLGDVVAVQKNLPLYKPGTERLTAVKAANNIDYWVMTKQLNNNRFVAYKVSCTGLDPTPVNSDVGVSHTYTYPNNVAQGTLKASPDGKKMAIAIGAPYAITQLFDFDNNTGLLSNPIDITGFAQTPTTGYIYGLEFSPNSRLLYVSTLFSGTINQYDISSGNPATIQASQYLINTNPIPPHGLQLTPDKRIFVATSNALALGAINNPDVHGSGCDYQPTMIDLGGRHSNSGLPAYIASFFQQQADFSVSFLDCHVLFSGSTNLTGTLSWYWDFGDGSFASGQTVSHSYRQTGSYNVKLRVSSTSSVCSMPVTDTATIIKSITINNVLAADYNYTDPCVNDPVQFTDNTVLTTGNITGRIWDFGDGSPTSNAVNPVHTFLNTGAYDVKLLVSTNGICNADSIIKKVYIDTKPSTAFSAPTGGCINIPVSFHDNSGNIAGAVNKWQWIFGDGGISSLKDPQHVYLNYGNYTVQLKVTSEHGCPGAVITKPIIIESKPLAAFDYQYPCLDKPTIFNNTSSNSFGSIMHNWNFGDGGTSSQVDPTHQYVSRGFYNVRLTVATVYGCRTSITKLLQVKQYADAGPDAYALYDKPHQLLGSGGGTYAWYPPGDLNNPAIANPIAILRHDQTFTLTTTGSDGCSATDTVNIKVAKRFDLYVPNAFTPNNDIINDKLKPYTVGISHLEYFKVYNRYGQEIFSTKEFGKGWDGRINGIPQPGGVYVWIVRAVDVFGKLIIKKGTSVLIR